ncbi:hypothetical protein [Streptomyces spiralis]
MTDQQRRPVPPAAEGLPLEALDSATDGATMLDAWAETGHGRNFLAHALTQLARDGWLRQQPGPGFETVRDRDDAPEPQVPPADDTPADHNLAADVECAIGLNIGNGGSEGVEAATAAVLAALDGPGPATADTAHVYLSTSCLHGQHGYCQSHTGQSGTKTPAQCKFCATPCVCPCHQPGPAATRATDTHNAGPTVREAAAQDAAHWNDKYAGEGA